MGPIKPWRALENNNRENIFCVFVNAKTQKHEKIEKGLVTVCSWFLRIRKKASLAK